jgi:hypothetical protein
MKQEFGLNGRLVCAVALGLSCVMTFGGEAPPPVDPTAPAKPAEKKPEDELSPSMDAKPFRFDMGSRRDPFIFISEIPAELIPTKDGDPTVKAPVLDKKVIEQVRAEAEAHYAEAERAFSKEGKAQEAINKCDEGLKVFAQFPSAGAQDEWRDVRERLFDLRKAAERVRQRQEAKKKFDDLNIRLTGIVSRERNSQAIINSRTVRKGDVVAASEAYDVVVDEIRNDQVVFVFQGFKMALNLSEGPK